MKLPTVSELNSYIGKNISKICGCSFINDADNHCAHFVCHVKKLNFGMTCFQLTNRGSKEESANVRVQEVFPQCRRVGKWIDKPSDLETGFIFITQASVVNLQTKTMGNIPKKHIGIFIGQNVWQYKNRFRYVIKQTPAEFSQHYSGTGFGVFFGEFPL